MFDRVSRIVFLALSCCAAQLALAKPVDGVSWNTQEKRVTMLVNWCKVVKRSGCASIPEETGAAAAPPRVTTESAVSVSVSSFNFVHYNVEYAIEEKEIQAYAYLSGIWDQILGFDLNKQLGIAGQDANWWKRIREVRGDLKNVVANYASFPGLTQSELNSLASDRTDYLQKVAELDRLRSQAFEAAGTVEELQKFDIIDKEHDTLVAAIATFADLAQRSARGDQKNIGTKKAGTYVTVNITAKPLAAAPASKLGSATGEYLVESKFPLLFHAGLTYNRLEDTKFETVRALEGRDLFVQVRDEKGTETFSAYLSYPIDDPAVDKARWFATLGSDFKELGDNIYVGASCRIKSRWFVSLGGVYGMQTEGQNQTTETSTEGPSRTLYEIVKEDREWKAFASISVKLY